MSDEKRESSPMIDDGGPQKRRVATSAHRQGRVTHRATPDRWFDTQINKLYAEVVSEPLPKEFLELVEKLREKKPG